MKKLLEILDQAKKELEREYNTILSIRIEGIEKLIKRNEIEGKNHIEECKIFLREVMDINNLQKYKHNLVEGMEYTVNDTDIISYREFTVEKYIICKADNIINVKMINGEKELNLKSSDFTLGFEIALLKAINKKYSMSIEKIKKEIEIELSEDLKSDFKEGLKLKAIDIIKLVLKHPMVSYTVRKDIKKLALKDLRIEGVKLEKAFLKTGGSLVLEYIK